MNPTIPGKMTISNVKVILFTQIWIKLCESANSRSSKIESGCLQEWSFFWDRQGHFLFVSMCWGKISNLQYLVTC